MGWQVVEITSAAMRSTISNSLKTSFKLRGRALKADVKEFGLKRGYRLEPSIQVPDTFAFEKLPLPFTCVFWTGGKNDRLTHASPLLTSIDGVDTESYGPDILHAWDLGPLNTMIAWCFHYWLRTKLWHAAHGGMLVTDDNSIALVSIKSELQMWYKEQQRSDKTWKLKNSEVICMMTALLLLLTILK